MPSGHMPTDVVNLFLLNFIGNDRAKKAAFLSWRSVSLSWSYASPEPMFNNISFDGWSDMQRFLDLHSTSFALPNHIRSTQVALNNLTPMDDKYAQTLQELMSVIASPQSLKIHATTGSIPKILSVVSRSWPNIARITLSGGTHKPAEFFTQLPAFPQLRSATLEDFNLEDVETGDGGAAPAFHFPASLEKLSLDKSSSLWPFFRTHVTPGGGFSNIHDLYIRSQLSYDEDGVFEMIECLQTIQGIHTLELDAIYDPNNPYLIQDMQKILRGDLTRRRRIPLPRIRGLRYLRLGLANVPADIALDCIGTYSLFLPFYNLDVSIEVEVPQCVDLWANSDPSAHLSSSLSSTQSAQGHTTIGAGFPLTVKGFPGTLPGELAASRRTMAYGYPVDFM